MDDLEKAEKKWARRSLFGRRRRRRRWPWLVLLLLLGAALLRVVELPPVPL